MLIIVAVAEGNENFTADGPAGQSDLRGPANDLERMRNSLERFGFGGKNVLVIQDAGASKAGIAESFRWLADRTQGRTTRSTSFSGGFGVCVMPHLHELSIVGRWMSSGSAVCPIEYGRDAEKCLLQAHG